MSVWLGGLVVLLVAALGGGFSGGLRRALDDVLPRSRSGASWCSIVSGVFASWRQVGFTIQRLHRRRATATSCWSSSASSSCWSALAAVSRSIVRKRRSAPLDAPDSAIAAIDERTVAGSAPLGRGRGRARHRGARGHRDARERAAGAQRALAEAVLGIGRARVPATSAMTIERHGRSRARRRQRDPRVHAHAEGRRPDRPRHVGQARERRRHDLGSREPRARRTESLPDEQRDDHDRRASTRCWCRCCR